MAKRNKSRKRRISRRTYRKNVVTTGKRVRRRTRLHLLSEPYNTPLRHRRLKRYNNVRLHNTLKKLTKADLYRPKYEPTPRRSHVSANADLAKLDARSRVEQKEAIKRIKECSRRKTRREVIFAKKFNKKGSGARKRKIRPESKIKC
jgi:hypothetical protein